MPISTPIQNIKMPPTSPLVTRKTQPGPPSRLTILVYGSPGAGKTYFAGTFPNPFFIDFQGGLMTVRDKEVTYIQPETYNELLASVAVADSPEFQTVILDTATELVRFLIQHACKVSGREMPTLAEWGMAIEYVHRLMRALIDLQDKHIVVTAEEITEKDEETGKILGSPDLPGSLRRKIPALFDCVFHLRNAFNPATSKKGRWLLTEPEGIYFAKDRTDRLDKLEVPDFTTIWTKVTGGGNIS